MSTKCVSLLQYTSRTWVFSHVVVRWQMGFFTEVGPLQVFVSTHVCSPPPPRLTFPLPLS